MEFPRSRRPGSIQQQASDVFLFCKWANWYVRNAARGNDLDHEHEE